MIDISLNDRLLEKFNCFFNHTNYGTIFYIDLTYKNNIKFLEYENVLNSFKEHLDTQYFINDKNINGIIVNKNKNKNESPENRLIPFLLFEIYYYLNEVNS